MVFAVHASRYGFPVVIPGTYQPGIGLVGVRCPECEGAGTLPGCEFPLKLMICHGCNGYGRLMTSLESNEFVRKVMGEEYLDIEDIPDA
jgi:hypothetical protein